MRSKGSRFTLGVWGWGCVRPKSHLCSQPSACVCVTAVRPSTLASASRMVPKACQVESWSRSYIGACRGSVCVSRLVSPQFHWRLQRRCLCQWFVSPQLYWRLQRRCLCQWFVSPQLYWRLQRKCLCERSALPQLYWCLQRRCLCEWSVSPQYIGVCKEEVSVWVNLWRRSYIDVSRGGVSVSDMCQVGVSYKNVK